MIYPLTTWIMFEGWKKSFFRAQAKERFLIGLFGEEVITDWAVENAKIYSQLEPDGFGKATTSIRRIERQAKLYGSICAVSTDDSARSVIRIDRCAIWNYREAARARGVPITLRSPCTYCTYCTVKCSMSENIRRGVSCQITNFEKSTAFMAVNGPRLVPEIHWPTQPEILAYDDSKYGWGAKRASLR